MNDTLEITTLGGLDIRVGGEPVSGFYSRKVEALLIYLACAGRPISRDVLADLLWDEVTQSRAMGNLRVVLHNLREKLGPYVDITRTTVALNTGNDFSTSSGQGVWFDVAELEDGLAPAAEPGGLASPAATAQVAEALSLYQGDFLAGFYVRDCPRFEEWQRVEQERLRNLVVRALDALVAYYQEQSAYDSALLYARRLAELDPLLEEVHRQVMVCLARTGQRCAALAQYETCRQILEGELYEAILAERLVPTAEVPPPRHNLPPPTTPFVGRGGELAELQRLLSGSEVRLVTVVGPGGAGKTRLALEAAQAQLDHFGDGVHFVPLAPLESTASIVPAILDAVGFALYEGEEGHTDITARQQLLAYLRDKTALLVMDNFEHLLSGVSVVSDVIQNAPQVKVLVTSRTSLNLREEQLYPLAGMDYPDWETPEDTKAYSAVALFLEGARRVRPDFEARGNDLIYLTRICRLVDGMPLGVLLAAGWVDTLTPAQIAEEIRRNLDFLETELRNIPERQRSMRAAFDHSWKLLTAREREIVQALSVFRGGWRREAAQAVAGASLRELRALVNKSLLQFVPRSETQTGQFVPRSETETGQFVPHTEGPTGGSVAETGKRTSEGRYEMHELLRQYAEQKLEGTPDGGAAARDRHSAHFCAALERWARALQGPERAVALEEMRADHDNIRTAWDWAVREKHLSRLGQAADGLGSQLYWRVRFREGERAFREAAEVLSALEKQPSAKLTEEISVELKRVRSRLLAWQANFCSGLGFRETSAQISRASIALLDEPVLARQDTRRERAWALCVAAYSESYGDWEQTERLFQQSLTLYRALGDSYMAALVLGFMGTVAEAKSDYPLARRRREESLALRREIRDTLGVTASLLSVGYIALIQGQLEEGERLMQQGHRNLQRSSGRRELVAGLLGSAMVFYYRGFFSQAHALLTESVAQQNKLAIRYSRDVFLGYISLGFAELHRGDYDAARAQAEEALTRARESDNLWVEGACRTLFGAVALAQGAHADAQRQLEQAVAEIYPPAVTPSSAWPGYLQVLATLAHAVRHRGRGAQAWKQLAEVLRRGIEIQDYLGLITALPAAALLIIDADQAERAIELYALASCHGYVANSRWFEDVAGKHIAAVAATLPPDVVAAAQERGRARDLWETAAELLEELRRPGWGGPEQ